ncbi:MAG: VOC family protein [Pseudomonadaceae bacterium]|nr:VOC family protein [Pseudomonadaceae bacterium]
MKASIDHIVLAAMDLLDAKAQWQRAMGTSVDDGGSHPGVGTRNALSGLADGMYVELLAHDPGQPARQQPTLPQTLSPFHWALAIDDLDAWGAALERQGIAHTGALNMSRKTPTGELLKWQLLFIRGDAGGGCVPFFINWLDSPHPSMTLTADARLLGLRLCAPPASCVHQLLPSIDWPDGCPQVSVETGPARLEFSLAGTGPARAGPAITWCETDPDGFRVG